MNLRDLKYLVAVADFAHFGKAAEACFVSQPALSMQIKKLEETLGAQLVERTNKTVFLTEIGHTITQHARDVLQRIDVMCELAHIASDPFKGELRLGIIPTVAPYLLPHIISSLTALLPNVTLLLIEEKTPVLLEKLSQGKIDAALLALPVADENFIATSLFDETFLLATHKSHPLAKRKTVLLTDLDNEKLLLLEDGHCLREQALAICQLANAKESTSFRATSLETLRHMIAANVGITLMPKLACKEDENIRYLSFSSHQPSRIVGMIWRSSTAKKVLLEKIVDHIKQIMKVKKSTPILTETL